MWKSYLRSAVCTLVLIAAALMGIAACDPYANPYYDEELGCIETDHDDRCPLGYYSKTAYNGKYTCILVCKSDHDCDDCQYGAEAQCLSGLCRSR